MKTELLNHFIEEMKKTMYEAGELALKSQKTVINEGKSVIHDKNDSDFLKRQRAAKTVIDDRIQEMLLQTAARVIDPSLIYCDAEEATNSVKLYSKTKQSLTLVIDPIDGTLEYVLGKNRYSICVSLIEEGLMLTSLVYFPARDEFYYTDTGGAFLKKERGDYKLTPPLAKSTTVYLNTRVSEPFLNKLKNRFHVVDDTDGIVTWPEALIKCIAGEYRMCIFERPMVRDIMLGAIISKIPKGYAVDFTGNKVQWLEGGRIDTVIFGFEPFDLLL